jgi:predicted dinucleotide-binding enzyme
MKIAIMGAGSIGSYFGAKLQRGGSDVTFIARGDHLRAIQRNGLTVEDPKQWRLSDADATDDPSAIDPVDIVLFCVKLRDTEAAARAIKSVLRRRAVARCAISSPSTWTAISRSMASARPMVDSDAAPQWIIKETTRENQGDGKDPSGCAMYFFRSCQRHGA